MLLALSGFMASPHAQSLCHSGGKVRSGIL